MTAAPERIETARLRLRRPLLDDAAEILASYAGDHEVCRYVGWPRHASLDDTRAFLEFADAEWSKRPAGPYLISLPEGPIVGSTGLAFESDTRAATGYVLARAHWGKGYAGEALSAMLSLAARLAVERLHALCHAAHRPSRRVLERAGFRVDASVRDEVLFPNLDGGTRAAVVCYACDPRSLAGPAREAGGPGPAEP